MKLEDFKNKVEVVISNTYDHYKVTIQYRGKEYKGTTILTSDAVTRIKLQVFCRDKDYLGGYTLKQAYQVLWNECKAINELK